MGVPEIPALQALLADLAAFLPAALGEQLVGIYLSGSLAYGDFDPQRSDVDFVAVTENELGEAWFLPLAGVAARLQARHAAWAPRLEGVFMSRAMIARWRPGQARFLALNTHDEFGWDGQGADGYIHRWVLREKGLALSGPPPAALVEPVGAAELRQATLATLHEWWAPMVADPFRLASREYQAYAVLTMCRMDYTLQHGAIVSKPEAARWALETWPPRWHGLVQRALAWLPDDGVQDGEAARQLIEWLLARFT